MIAHADYMSEYINRFLLPTLHKLKSENKLKPSGLNQTVGLFGIIYDYTGDVMDGEATGWGIAVSRHRANKYIGTFLSGKAEGILIGSSQHWRYPEQFYQGKENGCKTFWDGTCVDNMWYVDGKKIRGEEVTPETAWWNRDGTPNTANQDNFMDYV